MLNYELDEVNGILVVVPEGPLEARDFAQLAQAVDPWIERHGHLHGLMIRAEAFPGWRDFAALISHFRFVRDHHRRIVRVAAVTDNSFLAIAPQIARHFVDAELRHFAFHDKAPALAWLKQAAE